MTWLLGNYKLILGSVIAIVLFMTGWHFGAAGVQDEWDRDTLARDSAQIAQMKTMQDKQRKAEVQHDEDQSTINDLHDRINGMHLHIPTCGGATEGSKDGSSGILSNGVDEAFRHLQEGVSSLIERCDQLNIDAKEVGG